MHQALRNKKHIREKFVAFLKARIITHLSLFSVFILSVFVTGCILPFPHTRVSRPECGGFVSDVMTDNPISNATVSVAYEGGTNIIVHTDSAGRWMIPSEETWHAAVFIAPPMGYSLLPCFRGFSLPSMITIEADGYDTWEWKSWVDVDLLSNPTEDMPVVDRRKAQLKPKAKSQLLHNNTSICSNVNGKVHFNLDNEERGASCKMAGDVQKGLHFDLPDDGLALPLDRDASCTNADVIVYMISAKQDPSTPNEKFAYPCQKEFLDDYIKSYYKLRTDFVLVIDNYSPYPYVFSAQYQASGYESLELDFLTSDNRILTAKKRVPKILSDTPSANVLNPNWRWKCLISLDIRLWTKPEGFSVDMITHFRPRFAYGAFFVDGKYYRTINELEAHRRKERPFKSREGELVGKWMPFQPKQLCWRSWK